MGLATEYVEACCDVAIDVSGVEYSIRSAFLLCFFDTFDTQIQTHSRTHENWMLIMTRIPVQVSPSKEFNP